MGAVSIGGRAHRVRPLSPADVAPGALVRTAEGRRVYRVVCLDGGEAVLRNVRRPDLFDACGIAEMPRHYLLVDPEPLKG